MKQKKLLALIAFLSLFSLLIFSLLPVHGEREIYDAVIRFHVLANSDSEEDQALKIAVRDALLAATGDALAGLSHKSAEVYLEEHLKELETVAKATIERAGYDYPVTATLGYEDYPTREYDALAFPAGRYLSLRVIIGEGAGHNWWCCLFPPLCLGVATVSPKDAEDAFIAVGLTPSQYKVITESDKPTYKVRFKLLELFGKGTSE